MTTTVAAMVGEARTRVRELTPTEFEAEVEREGTLVVDLREPEEIDEHGLISGAHHVPRGLLEFWADPASPIHRDIFEPSRPTLLYCAAGSRSALGAARLQDLGYQQVAHLAGGIGAWKEAGLPVFGAVSD